MDQIDARAASCGYTSYIAEHLTFPPKGLFPLPNNSTEAIRGCELWNDIFDATLLVNPAFNIYRIFDTVRSLNLLQRACTQLSSFLSVPIIVGRPRLPRLLHADPIPHLLRPHGSQEGDPRARERHVGRVLGHQRLPARGPLAPARVHRPAERDREERARGDRPWPRGLYSDRGGDGDRHSEHDL